MKNLSLTAVVLKVSEITEEQNSINLEAGIWQTPRAYGVTLKSFSGIVYDYTIAKKQLDFIEVPEVSGFVEARYEVRHEGETIVDNSGTEIQFRKTGVFIDPLNVITLKTVTEGIMLDKSIEAEEKTWAILESKVLV